MELLQENGRRVGRHGMVAGHDLHATLRLNDGTSSPTYDLIFTDSPLNFTASSGSTRTGAGARAPCGIGARCSIAQTSKRQSPEDGLLQVDRQPQRRWPEHDRLYQSIKQSRSRCHHLCSSSGAHAASFWEYQARTRVSFCERERALMANSRFKAKLRLS